MSTLRPLLGRRIAAVSLLVLAPVLTSCGFGEQTDAVYQSSTGVMSRTGQVWILNALVVTGTDGEGTFAGTLVNQSRTQSAQLVSVSGASGKVAVNVPAGTPVNLATKGRIRVSDPAIKPGGYVKMSFQFSNGQTTDLTVPVVANSGDYADVPVGAPSSSASPSASPSGSPSATATPTATPSAG